LEELIVLFLRKKLGTSLHAVKMMLENAGGGLEIFCGPWVGSVGYFWEASNCTATPLPSIKQ